MVAGVFIMGHNGVINAPSSDNDFKINDVIDNVSTQVSDELKKSFLTEIENFFRSNDLEASLGISPAEHGKIESSIKMYLDNYNLDEDKLNEAKASIKNLLENAKGLSADEIQDKISEIFEKD